MGSQANPGPENLVGQSLGELRALAESMGEPAYRGSQIYHSLYRQRRFDLSRFVSLPAAFRTRLAEAARIELPRVLQRHASADGTIRYVLAVGDRSHPATIETVFIPDKNRQTICISSQAGCAVDCRFCLTATLGLKRNLTAGEIVGQVLLALDQAQSLRPQTNVVLMGQGEPLLNYDAVMGAVRILLDPEALAISPRRVTLSTSGILPGIERLAQEGVRPKLAISLNASGNQQRDLIMPINRKYPIEALVEACARYPLRPWEHITFEYVLLGGLNDTADDARRLAALIAPLRAKINLIPWNPGELPYHRPADPSVEEFRRILTEKGRRAFVRCSRGQDVMAACGQLALSQMAAAV